MKKKIFMLLVMVMTVMAASAVEGLEGFKLSTTEPAITNGNVTFMVNKNIVTSANEGDLVTVIVEPKEGFFVAGVTGQWSAAVVAARNRGVGMLNDIDLQPMENEANTWTFEMKRANAKIDVNYLILLTHPDITVSIDEAFYTGQAQKPTVTVKFGDNALTEGEDFTVTYADNTYPGEATVTIAAVDGSLFYGERTEKFTVEDGVISLTAEGYSGVYDGDVHGITVKVPDGATVKFGETEGVYNLEVSPTYVDAGTYTVYYQVTRTYYATETGQAVVYIAKAPATISYATTSIKKTYGDAEFTNPLTMTGDGIETYSTSDRDVAVVDPNSGEVTIVGEGTATITATAADGKNYAYDPNSASYEITVGAATMTVTSEGWTGVYDGQSHSITVNAPEGAKVRYGRAEDSYNLTRKPTYTNTGTYTCYYQVTMDNYKPVTDYETVTIKKAAGAISFEAESVKKAKGDAAFTNPLTNTGDGVVSYDTSDSKIARVNATTGEVTLGKSEGTATITATVKDGPNYDYAVKTATYTVVVGEGGDEPGGDEPGGDEPGVDPGENVIVINADANEADGDNEKVDGVKLNVVVDKTAQPRQEERTFVDPATGEEVTKTVTIVPITLESIIIPQQEGASATDKQGIVVTIPPYVVGPDGTIYEITSIAAGAFVSNEPTAVITTVVLPDTEKPLTLEPGCMDNGTGESMRVIAPLQHLDDYALNTALASSYEALKLSAMVTPPNRYWTFSCGVDVLVPAGVSVYTAHVNSDKEVVITQIPEDKLTVDGEQIIKANNGVLVACTDGSNGNAYEIVANPGRQKSGSTIVTNDAKSYGADNQLEPVIEQKNYAASDYYVLVDNEFHPILYNNSKVSACKAVLKFTGGSANARLIITEGNNSPTGIDSMVNGQCSMVNGSMVNVYDLNGRMVQTPAKGGVYIINNKKVVIKK